jgi:site-specific recombinase XerC
MKKKTTKPASTKLAVKTPAAKNPAAKKSAPKKSPSRPKRKAAGGQSELVDIVTRSELLVARLEAVANKLTEAGERLAPVSTPLEIRTEEVILEPLDPRRSGRRARAG